MRDYYINIDVDECVELIMVDIVVDKWEIYDH